ncbi:diguanylate cyclase [Paenibacillus sp. MBLB4367]|uniref:sensor domain-containing diguanylate cyclase n=1 Tax=Paenibacillus sp. MBLB4367 TaxID=3384767 RepID=UPI0039080973
MPILREIQENQRNKISLATLLSGLAALSVMLTLTILLVSSYQSQKQSLFETTLSLNHSTAANMSQTMDSLFKSMRGSLKYTASYFSEHYSPNEKEWNTQLELLRHNSNYFNSISLVDETGLVRSVAPQSLGSAGKSVATEAAKEALSLRKPYLSKPYTSTAGRLLVFMSEPIFDKDGLYRGFIAGTIYLQENNVLNMIFGSNRIDEKGSYFYVVDADGNLLFHPDKNRLGENNSNANKVVQMLLQGKSGQEQVVNSRGVTLLAGYSSISENGWGIVMQSPMKVVYEQLNRHIKGMLLYTLPPFLLLMLAAIWLARRLAKPFVSLADLVSNIGTDKEQLPALSNHWNREADLLTRTVTLALEEIRKQTDQLTRAATTDPLTGLMNRRTMESLISRWTAEKTAFSIIIMDLDKFKTINDTFGHQAGDEVLKHLAGIAKLAVGPHDVCCRFGGEEFVVLLPSAADTDAYIVAERIRQSMESSDNPVGRTVTVSLGVACYPQHADSAEALFQLADQSLYMAKRAGRNRAVMAQVLEQSAK